jgi:hypothetical protein
MQTGQGEGDLDSALGLAGTGDDDRLFPGDTELDQEETI